MCQRTLLLGRRRHLFNDCAYAYGAAWAQVEAVVNGQTMPMWASGVGVLMPRCLGYEGLPTQAAA